MLLVVLFLSVCASDCLTVYDIAKFEPNDIHFLLDNKTSINTKMECACWCYNHTMCLTATFFGINQQCILYFSRLDQGKLYVMSTNEMISVLSFKNRTLPGK